MFESYSFAGFTFPRRLPLISRMEARERPASYRRDEWASGWREGFAP
jgi:hypothetical protein